MQLRIDNSAEFEHVLRKQGFRATVGRIALLSVLKRSVRPIAVDKVVRDLHGKLDQANTYRALEAFVQKGLVRRVDLGKEYAHYELAGGAHHHHVVCDSCGKVADVEVAEHEMERAALRTTPDFMSIRTHSLEFFGMCKACV